MSYISNTLSNNAEVMLLVSFITMVIAVLACLATLRATKPERYLYRMTSELETMQESFMAASKFHLEVAATLAYLEQIQEHPELVNSLGRMSRDVMAASLLQRMNLIAGTLAVMHKKLEEKEEDYANYEASYKASQVATIRKEIAKLQADQQSLHQLCELLGGVSSAV